MKKLCANLWNVQNGLSTSSREKVQAFCRELRADFVEELSELKSNNDEAIDLIMGSKFFDLAE